jgi:tRNA G18 (ribose-2'-O)-methylase SpoU
MIHKYSTDELVAQKPSEEEFKKLPRNPIVFVLHNIRSLQNVGLFFRLADAIRAEKVYLTGYTGYPKIENDTRREGSIIHAENEINKTAIKLVPFVSWEKSEDIVGVLNNLGSQGYQLVSVEQTDQSAAFDKAEYKKPVALIFGHEREGVDQEILERSDLVVHIPMLGMGNSHNVAVSAAIVSYHILSKIQP